MATKKDWYYGKAPLTVVICECGNNKPSTRAHEHYNHILIVHCPQCLRQWYICDLCEQVRTKMIYVKQIRRHLWSCHHTKFGFVDDTDKEKDVTTYNIVKKIKRTRTYIYLHSTEKNLCYISNIT